VSPSPLLPAELVASLDPATEVLVVDLDGFGAGRAVWNAAEVVGQRLDPHAVSATAVREGDDVLVTVTASAYARDVTLLVDRAAPRASVDQGLVTLLAGESTVFRVSATDGVDSARFAADDVVRHAGALVGVVAL
jgi:beta-mannosidase